MRYWKIVIILVLLTPLPATAGPNKVHTRIVQVEEEKLSITPPLASYGITGILNFSNLGEEDISIPLDQDKCSINISISHSFEEFGL